MEPTAIVNTKGLIANALITAAPNMLQKKDLNEEEMPLALTMRAKI